MGPDPRARRVLVVNAFAALALTVSGCGAGGRHATHLASTGQRVVRSEYAQPDPEFTPGTLCQDTDKYFDGYRYAEHVAHCKRHVTKAMKLEIAKNYGVDEADFSDYEFDHYLPLGIGGSTDVSNIWPQPIDEAKVKDKLENQLYEEMKDGDVSQADAVQQIRDWGH